MPGGVQVDPPDPRPLAARQPHGFVDPRLEAIDPVAQGLGIVAGEPLDVVDDEAGALQRELHPRHVQRLAVGKDIALRHRPGLVVDAVLELGDAVVEQPPAWLQQPRQAGRIGVDLVLADVLDHADARDRVERLAAQLAIVGHLETDYLFRGATPADALAPLLALTLQDVKRHLDQCIEKYGGVGGGGRV